MNDTYVIGKKMARNDCKTAIYTVANFGDQSLLRACVARGAWHPRNFRTSHLAPTYFEVLSTNHELSSIEQTALTVPNF